MIVSQSVWHHHTAVEHPTPTALPLKDMEVSVPGAGAPCAITRVPPACRAHSKELTIVSKKSVITQVSGRPLNILGQRTALQWTGGEGRYASRTGVAESADLSKSCSR